MKYLIILTILLTSITFSASPQSATEEARNLIEMGYLADAKTVLGTSSSPEALLLRGRLEFFDYNFSEAANLYAQYKRAIKKADPSAEYLLFENQLDIARNALETVEDLLIIDEFEVDADNFMKTYRLPLSAGRLLDPSEIPFPNDRQDAAMAFTNERGDFMMWSHTDENGVMSLAESSKLTDDSWEQPSYLPEFLYNGGNVDYPFMMADGTTLYFASDGDDSMGGYDIFIASRDPATGEYRQPQNVGMPYNSPFDDYMLVIDELNGIGWWATDRNQIPGKVTVYVYKLNDLRKNLDPDDENIIELASLSDITLTVDEDTDVDSLKRMVQNIRPGVPEKKKDFSFPIKAGVTYTNFSDFKSASARENMKKYLSDLKTLEADKAELNRLRKKYHGSSPSARNALAGSIKSLESKVEQSDKDLNLLRGKIVSSEKSGK